MKLPRNQKVFTLIVIIATPLVGTVSTSEAATTAITMTVTSSVPPIRGLTITAPSATSLGSSVSFPSTFTTIFSSPVEVTDSRGTSTGWTSQVLVSDLTQNITSEVIPASVFSYTTGTVTKTGTGTLTITPAPAPSAASTVVAASSVTTNLSAKWTPTLTLAEPNAPGIGSYSGTVTSSVF